MNLLIFGSKGFIGFNLLQSCLANNISVDVCDDFSETSLLNTKAAWADVIVHAAGFSRGSDRESFAPNNERLMECLVTALEYTVGEGNKCPVVIFLSSRHAVGESWFGKSKLECERILISSAEKLGIRSYILRIPNVFGKWSRPNHNSFVTTVCYNVPRKIAIELFDSDCEIPLLFIDDLVQVIFRLINDTPRSNNRNHVLIDEFELTTAVTPRYLLQKVIEFDDQRCRGFAPLFRCYLDKCLYATYLSYLPMAKFVYTLDRKEDSRGYFVEILKSLSTGQLSVFSVEPGAIRGNHYHNIKSEKFIVLSGSIHITMMCIKTRENFSENLSEDSTKVVETIPGWTHAITNSSRTTAIVLCWANEDFKIASPDTYAYDVSAIETRSGNLK